MFHPGRKVWLLVRRFHATYCRNHVLGFLKGVDCHGDKKSQGGNFYCRHYVHKALEPPSSRIHDLLPWE